MPKYGAKRDANEPELVKLARRLGAELRKLPPLDWWVGHRGRWVPVEIKTDEGEYTEQQVEFIGMCVERGLPVWTWRTESDVMRNLGARRTA
jgi:hypothetical protein